jgi:hypothetical protein
MKPILVKDLKKLMSRIPSRYDDLVVLVSDDEEENGYHALFTNQIFGGSPYEFYNQDTKEMETRDTIILC